MNRRNFIVRALAGAVAAAVVPVAKLFAKEKPITFDGLLDSGNELLFPKEKMLMDPYNVATWSGVPRDVSLDIPDYRWYLRTSKKGRRVKVMTAWWIEHEGGSIRSDVAVREDRERDILKPRKAYSWTWRSFESLKKGNHFRLFDEVDPMVVYTLKPEDGSTVYVAGDNAKLELCSAETPEWMKRYSVDIAHAYPGKGAGFDWCEWNDGSPSVTFSYLPVGAKT